MAQNSKSAAGTSQSQPDPQMQKKLKAKEREIDELRMKLKSLENIEKTPSNEEAAVIETLIAKVEELEKRQATTPQVIQQVDGKKPKYRTPVAEDILPKEQAVTFTARNV